MHEFQQHVERVTGEIANCLQSISVDAVDRALITINSAPRLFIAGAGRSGLAMRAFAMRLMHLGKECHFLGDVTTPSVANPWKRSPQATTTSALPRPPRQLRSSTSARARILIVRRAYGFAPV